MAPPTMRLATPPSNSQMDLSVGEPVKKREKSEPTELDALIPKNNKDDSENEKCDSNWFAHI